MGHLLPFPFNEVRGAAPGPRCPPPQPEKDKEGKENLSLSPHKNFPAFLSLFLPRGPSTRPDGRPSATRSRGGKSEMEMNGGALERVETRSSNFPILSAVFHLRFPSTQIGNEEVCFTFFSKVKVLPKHQGYIALISRFNQVMLLHHPTWKNRQKQTHW